MGSCAFHRPSTLHTALDMRPRKRCCVETACARARTMAPLTAVSLAASAVRDSRVCSAAPPACPTMVESRLNRHMGDNGVAQAAPFTLKIGRSTPLPRICKIYSMCKALRKTLATQHGGRSGSTHLACGRTRGSQSSGRGESNTRRLHAKARERRASPGSVVTNRRWTSLPRI